MKAFILLFLAASAFAQDIKLAPHERLVSILGTNDIHGGIEATKAKNGSLLGGMAFFGGVVRSIREGLEEQYGSNAGVLVLDGGDQFQGSLLSNYSEGELLFKLMNRVGYDAIVPGNHDYDFGPQGWLQDSVSPDYWDQNPRGALEKIAKIINFPLLSANTYYRASLTDIAKLPVDVDSVGCKPLDEKRKIEFQFAKRPSFLKPYIIKEVAGVRVAMIGLDHEATAKLTTFENVSDLCFRDAAEEYLDVRKSIENEADVFVIVIHNGDVNNDKKLTALLEKINKDKKLVDAVVAGHTHVVHNISVKGTPAIQSGSSLEMFGRIDLVWNNKEKKIVDVKTRSFAGVSLFHAGCAENVSFCKNGKQKPFYEGMPTKPDRKIVRAVETALNELKPLSEIPLGETTEEISVHRISESPLANRFTDLMIKITGADVAMLNSSGIRDSLPKGKINYSDLFKVFPFSNIMVVLKPISAEKLVSILKQTIVTCGAFGTIVHSGLKVEFSRDCSKTTNGKDMDAKLLSVVASDGEVLYSEKDGIIASQTKMIKIATLSYLISDGSSFDALRGAAVEKEIGLLRESFKDYLKENPMKWDASLDGRFKQIP